MFGTKCIILLAAVIGFVAASPISKPNALSLQKRFDYGSSSHTELEKRAAQYCQSNCHDLYCMNHTFCQRPGSGTITVDGTNNEKSAAIPEREILKRQLTHQCMLSNCRDWYCWVHHSCRYPGNGTTEEKAIAIKESETVTDLQKRQGSNWCKQHKCSDFYCVMFRFCQYKYESLATDDAPSNMTKAVTESEIVKRKSAIYCKAQDCQDRWCVMEHGFCHASKTRSIP